MCALGLDVGTSFLVSATKDVKNEEAQVEIKSVRDAFLDIEADQSVLNMLKMSNVSYVQEKDSIYIVGEPALSVANLLKREARRPLSKGVISSGELDAEKMLIVLLKNILNKPQVENENVFYSVPAKSIDVNMDVIYHEAMFKKIIESLGFRATSMNEAAAIVYSNCASDGFTALASSCLTPGQKIITKRGFISIEEIKEGDQVLNKEGEWALCTPTSREYNGKVYKIWGYGNGKVEVTEDHELWILRDKKWSWIPAKEVIKGDMVMQPWPNFTFNDRIYVCREERVTSSSETKEISLFLSSEVAELIGYFLGDGNIEYACSNTDAGAGIGFTFDKKEVDNIERVKMLVKSIFDKDMAEYDHGEQALRLKMYSKSFSKWIIDNCYDSNKEKVVPWDISDLSDNQLRFILRGLICSDGNYTHNHIGFSNTSSNLSQFVYLALLRLGISLSYSIRCPREGKVEVDTGRVINGKKDCYEIQSTGIEAFSLIKWFDSPSISQRRTYNFGYTAAKICDISERDYSGKVYDLSIIDGKDRSFCVPGISLHNCGAGMINTSLVYQTMVGMSFSLSRAGDWIDESSAKATGSTATRLMSIKEKGVDLLNPSDGDSKYQREREAIVVYYRNLIHYVIDSIKKEFKKDNSKIELPEEIPWIISGGTSKAKNFLEFFKGEFEKDRGTFPINISDIRMANDPLNDVAKGLLIAAMNE